MKYIIPSITILLASVSCFAQNPRKEEVAIKQLIEDYKVSINKTDTLLGANV